MALLIFIIIAVLILLPHHLCFPDKVLVNSEVDSKVPFCHCHPPLSGTCDDVCQVSSHFFEQQGHHSHGLPILLCPGESDSVTLHS